MGRRSGEEGGDPDRQKVLTYRQVDTLVHSNTSVRNLWRRMDERVNTVLLLFPFSFLFSLFFVACRFRDIEIDDALV